MSKLSEKTIIIRKLLRDIQGADGVEALKKFHVDHPEIHWTSLNYEKTYDTVLHVACRLGSVNVINFCLATYDPCIVHCKNIDFKTPLHEAAQFGHCEIVELLIQHGASVHALKQGDWTPLMLACTKTSEGEFAGTKKVWRNYKTAKVLVENGAEVNYRNKDGWTALHLITREGTVKIFKMLLKHNLDVMQITRNGRTALHIAALHNKSAMARLLIELGLDVNKADNCGNTPLHDSVLSRNLKMFILLIENGADIYSRNKSDFTILHLAASQGNIELIEYIVSILNVDINITTKENLTPMHCAARCKHMDAFKYFVQQGADCTIEDNFNRKPSHFLAF